MRISSNLLKIKKLPKEWVFKQVSRSPKRRGARRLWFLYEFVTGKRLDLPDLGDVKPFLILNPRRYYTAPPILRPRYGILDNLLGNAKFCPTVRRTRWLKPLPSTSFDLELSFPTKEEASLVTPAPDMGRLALDDASLIALHNQITSLESGFRPHQNYRGREVPVYLPPAPEDLLELMEGWRASANRILSSDLPPDVAAATIAFSFDMIHPFVDGNKRICRFLLHPILKAMGFEPWGPILPIGHALMRHDRKCFKRRQKVALPVMKRTHYHFEEDGRFVRRTGEIDLYRYLDYTPLINFFTKLFRQVVKNDLPKEIAFWSELEQHHRKLRRLVPHKVGRDREHQQRSEEE